MLEIGQNRPEKKVGVLQSSRRDPHRKKEFVKGRTGFQCQGAGSSRVNLAAFLSRSSHHQSVVLRTSQSRLLIAAQADHFSKANEDDGMLGAQTGTDSSNVKNGHQETQILRSACSVPKMKRKPVN